MHALGIGILKESRAGSFTSEETEIESSSGMDPFSLGIFLRVVDFCSS